MAHQKGLTLVEIPCWWTGDMQSLAATILFQRPDQEVADIDSTPIPLNPPPHYFKPNTIPSVGELMLASFPVTEANFDSTWWIGEKYDGLRCCWNPENVKLYGRNGRELILPTKMRESFPANFIDGELWFGRGQYQNVFLLISDSTSVPWQFLRCIVFDDPFYQNHQLPFEERYTHLLSAEHFSMEYKSERDMKKTIIEGIIKEGGEGIMLRKRGSLYEQGRSLSLIKLKTAKMDKEGMVVQILDDNSIIVKLPNGQKMTVPERDVEIEREQREIMMIGDIVSFECETHARREVPVGPRVFRIRRDLSWDDVLLNHEREANSLNASSLGDYKSEAHKHWTAKNMRLFLESFIRSRGLNPFVADTWYQSSLVSEINKSKKGRAILQKFKGGYIKAVQKLFPEINFDPTLFQRAYWGDIRVRRKFFENYAKTHGFDHQQASNWYSQSVESILATKGASRVVTYHENSVAKALLDLFPNIGLDESKIETSQSVFQYAANRRNFFESVAKEGGFDPLVPDNWYSLPRSKLLAVPGARSVLVYYRFNIAKALRELFPGIEIDEAKFKFYWRDSNNRRLFFENYAKSNQFDPLIPDSWYSHPIDKIKLVQDSASVLFYHGDSVVKALLELFPEIGLNKLRLMEQYVKLDIKALKKYFEEVAIKNTFDPLVPDDWINAHKSNVIQNIPKHISLVIKVYFNNNVPQAITATFPDIGLDVKQFSNPRKDLSKSNRSFFENYAKAYNFDPEVAKNWYKQPIKRIMNFRGATKVLSQYNSSVPKALFDVFPDIGLDQSQFYNSWKNPASRRRFFENFAKANNFDPLIPSNWYIQSRPTIYSFMGGERVLSYHNGSVSQALMDLFPEIGLDVTEFKNSHTYWKYSDNRRNFFISYAKAHNFDPHDASCWYSQRVTPIKEAKGASHVLRHHNNNVISALVDLFPDLQFDSTKFKYKHKYT